MKREKNGKESSIHEKKNESERQRKRERREKGDEKEAKKEMRKEEKMSQIRYRDTLHSFSLSQHLPQRLFPLLGDGGGTEVMRENEKEREMNWEEKRKRKGER